MNVREKIIIGWSACLLSCASVACETATPYSGVETYAVARGEFINSVTETGELDAVKSTLIQAPPISWRFGALKIKFLVEDGSEVKQDDALIQFDQSEVQKSISEAQAELEIARSELRKTSVKQESEIEELQANLEIARLNHRISQLKLDQATFEAEIDRKRIELDLEKSTIALEKAQQEIENKKRVHSQEISKLELKTQQAQTKLDEAMETLEKLTVSAPTPGIAIIQKNWQTDAKYQIDDQTYPGWPMIGLPDLSSMKAQILINEVDISKIKVGQEAVVRMDAYPDNAFKGKVVEMAVLGRNKTRESKVKVFDITILLDQHIEELMPGMTVSAEIVVERIPDVVFVPLEALFIKEGKSTVYVEKGGAFEPREVTPGAENDNYVIIQSGLSEGERVALVDPTAMPSDQKPGPSPEKTDGPPTATGGQ
jgi:RND family efflux transporter MFP subunit